MVTQLNYDEWCPNCGEGVDTLSPLTGWCYPCSGQVVCERCGNGFTPYQNSRKTCTPCRNIQWLERNADNIERVMFHRRCTVIEAIIVVHDDNRPRCVMCGDQIKHGTKGRTIFCGKRDACRRASIRFNRYRTRKGLSYDDALQKALRR